MSAAWVPCNATVSRWFTRRRGTAVAIASSGGSLGNLIVPTLAAALVTWWGWRKTLAAVAIFSAALMLLAARYMIRDPESVGLWPDGEPPAPSALASPGQRLDEVCWTAPFLLLIAIYFLTWVPVFVPFVHAAAYAEDLGLSKLAAGSVISAIGIGGVLGRLSAGVVSDRIGRLPSLLAMFALQVVAFVAFAAARGIGVLWLASMTFGFSYGGGVTLLPALCGDLFGRAHVAAIVGTIFAVAGSPSAIGPYVAGWLFDVTGRYGAAFVCSAALNAGALALTWVLMRRTAANS
jgi:predicted MFS family arabinose efflux permease